MQCNHNSFIKIINFLGLFRNSLRCRKTGACRILVPLRYIILSLRKTTNLSTLHCFVYTNCFPTGVEVTHTTLVVTSGSTLIERDSSHPISFNLTIESNPDGGSVSGTDLWSIQAYASDRDTPGGSNINPVDVTLDSTQGSAGITAGINATIHSLHVDLDLDGYLCSDLKGICVELSKNPLSNPDFTLDASPTILKSCYPASCSGECSLNYIMNVNVS